MECEICGARADRKAEIEGAVLNVCRDCSAFGREIEIKGQARAINPLKLPEEMSLAFADNFSGAVRQAREKKRLSQEQLASAIKEKLSLIKRMEEDWKPPLHVARKIEKFLGIKILESIRHEAGNIEPARKEVTIGDVIILKKKKQ